MSWEVVVSDHDKSRWKQARNRYLTASDAKLFAAEAGMITLPPYIRETPDDVFAEKNSGEERVFRASAQASLAHGRHSEEDALEKASLMLGLPMVPFHYMCVNDRWSRLAATMDSLGMVNMLVPPDFSFARTYEPTDKWTEYETQSKVIAVREELEQWQHAGDTTCIVEMKLTDSWTFRKRGEPRSWVEVLPDFYKPQCWMQMAILELDRCIIVGQLGLNMVAYVIEQNPDFIPIMDKMNTLAELELAS